MNILLTGASRGIGAAAIRQLVETGHRVVGHSSRGGDGHVAGDLADPAAPKAIFKAALEALDGRIDVLVNNAGIYEPVSDTADDAAWHAAWDRTMTVNLQASVDLCRLAIAHFRDREPNESGERGRIVNVVSRASYRGDSPAHWHYAASKAALVGVTKTIARGYAAEGIFAFAVAPGFTVSEMTEDYLTGRGGAQILADIPLGRVASTDEIGAIIHWLASAAPASATGTIVDANGASYVR